MILVVIGGQKCGRFKGRRRDGGTGGRLNKGTGGRAVAYDPGAVSDLEVTLSLIWAVKVGSDSP